MGRKERKERLIDNIPDYHGIGIYAIVNNCTGKMYIGSSVNVRKRLLTHDSSFRTGRCNKAFKEDIKKGHRFSAKVLKKIPYGTNRFQLFETEKKYVDAFGTMTDGYNTETVPNDTREEFERIKNLYQQNRRTSEKTKIEMTAYIDNIIEKYSSPIMAK